MTLRVYADHKGWPLEAVTVSLSHRKIHAKDCESCATESGSLDRIKRQIEVLGPLDADQRQRLMEIADTLPGAPDALRRNRRGHRGKTAGGRHVSVIIAG